MSAYEFAVTCPRCGTPLVHENASPPMDCGMRVTAIAKCNKPRCNRRWQIVTELLDFAGNVPLPAPLKDGV